MTKNQIEYWKYIEDSRHNKETEKEQHRSNRQREIEQSRTNLSNEDIARERNRISRQQNIINMNYNDRYLSETERANKAREAYNATMAEISQGNVDLGYAQVANAYRVAQLNYDVGMANVGATYANLAELNRSNLAKESETNRSNLVNEAVRWKTAGTEMYKAQTTRQQLSFDMTKWSDPVARAQRQADYFHTIGDTNRNKSQESLNYSNISTNKSKQFQNYTSGAKNISDIITNTSRTVINGAQLLLGGK